MPTFRLASPQPSTLMSGVLCKTATNPTWSTSLKALSSGSAFLIPFQKIGGFVQQSAVRTESRIERYSWMALAASALLGVISALVTTMPPISWFWNPVYESAYSIMGAWGVTWVGFNVLALIVT